VDVRRALPSLARDDRVAFAQNDVPHTVTVTTRGLNGLIAFARQRGVDVEALIQASGVDASRLAHPDARITRAEWAWFWERVSEKLHDPSLALTVAKSLPFGAFDVLDYVVVTSATVGDALYRLRDYFRLIHDRTTVQVLESADHASVTMTLHDDVVGATRFSTEFAFACILLRFQYATGGEWQPLRVRFTHPLRGELAGYHDLFGPDVSFDAPLNEFVFAPEIMRYPMLRADPLLNDVLRRHVAVLMDGLPGPDGMVGDVRHLIKAAVAEGDPSMDRVASQLGVSPRTLQRRLRHEGTAFAELVDEVRYELAVDCLDDPRMAISEIGFLLGFSEPSAFHRAFRRWSGMTPGEFRRAREAGTPVPIWTTS